MKKRTKLTLAGLRDLRVLAQGSDNSVVAMSKEGLLEVFDLAEEHLIAEKAKKRRKRPAQPKPSA